MALGKGEGTEKGVGLKTRKPDWKLALATKIDKLFLWQTPLLWAIKGVDSAIHRAGKPAEGGSLRITEPKACVQSIGHNKVHTIFWGNFSIAWETRIAGSSVSRSGWMTGASDWPSRARRRCRFWKSWCVQKEKKSPRLMAKYAQKQQGFLWMGVFIFFLTFRLMNDPFLQAW